MSFESALQTATAMATEYTGLTRQISGMACAADHDPRWSDADEDRLKERYQQQSELATRLAATLAELERDRDAWRAFLTTSIDRLAALVRAKHLAEYERDCWTRWLAGDRPDEPAEIFARGVDCIRQG